MAKLTEEWKALSALLADALDSIDGWTVDPPSEVVRLRVEDALRRADDAGPRFHQELERKTTRSKRDLLAATWARKLRGAPLQDLTDDELRAEVRRVDIMSNRLANELPDLSPDDPPPPELEQRRQRALQAIDAVLTIVEARDFAFSASCARDLGGARAYLEQEWRRMRYGPPRWPRLPSEYTELLAETAWTVEGYWRLPATKRGDPAAKLAEVEPMLERLRAMEKTFSDPEVAIQTHMATERLRVALSELRRLIAERRPAR